MNEKLCIPVCVCVCVYVFIMFLPCFRALPPCVVFIHSLLPFKLWMTRCIHQQVKLHFNSSSGGIIQRNVIYSVLVSLTSDRNPLTRLPWQPWKRIESDSVLWQLAEHGWSFLCRGCTRRASFCKTRRFCLPAMLLCFFSLSSLCFPLEEKRGFLMADVD